jgi:hypothetical protein
MYRLVTTRPVSSRTAAPATTTYLDSPKLLTLGKHKVHVLVVREHLANERATVVPVRVSATSTFDANVKTSTLP